MTHEHDTNAADTLADLITAALVGSGQAGYARGRFIAAPANEIDDDHYRQAANDSRESADTAAMAMWRAFYRYAAEHPFGRDSRSPMDNENRPERDDPGSLGLLVHSAHVNVQRVKMPRTWTHCPVCGDTIGSGVRA